MTNRRNATSLLEVLSVLVIMGVVASGGIAVVSSSFFEMTQARSEGVQIVSDLRRAREVAVASRIDVQMAFKQDGARVVAYEVAELAGARRPLVTRLIPENVEILCKQSGVRFTPEGVAAEETTLEISGGSCRLRLRVSSMTGALHLEKP